MVHFDVFLSRVFQRQNVWHENTKSVPLNMLFNKVNATVCCYFVIVLIV